MSALFLLQCVILTKVWSWGFPGKRSAVFLRMWKHIPCRWRTPQLLLLPLAWCKISATRRWETKLSRVALGHQWSIQSKSLMYRIPGTSVRWWRIFDMAPSFGKSRGTGLLLKSGEIWVDLYDCMAIGWFLLKLEVCHWVQWRKNWSLCVPSFRSTWFRAPLRNLFGRSRMRRACQARLLISPSTHCWIRLKVFSAKSSPIQVVLLQQSWMSGWALEEQERPFTMIATTISLCRWWV